MLVEPDFERPDFERRFEGHLTVPRDYSLRRIIRAMVDGVFFIIERIGAIV